MVEPWLQLNAMTPSFMRLPRTAARERCSLLLGSRVHGVSRRFHRASCGKDSADRSYPGARCAKVDTGFTRQSSARRLRCTVDDHHFIGQSW